MSFFSLYLVYLIIYFYSTAAPFYTFVAFCRSGGAVRHEVKELVRNKSCNNFFGRFSLCLGSDKLTCTAAEVYFSLWIQLPGFKFQQMLNEVSWLSPILRQQIMQNLISIISLHTKGLNITYERHSLSRISPTQHITINFTSELRTNL